MVDPTAAGHTISITFVSRRILPAAGGIESYAGDLARELARRHRVRIVAQRDDDGRIMPVVDAIRPRRPFAAEGPLGSTVQVAQLRVPLLRRVALLGVAGQFVPGLRRSRHGRLQELAGAAYGRLVGPEVARAAGRPDVLHVLGGSEIAVAGVHAARLLGIPVVVTPFAHLGQWDDDAASAAAYRRADAVVATLQADARTYLALGVPPERVHVRGLCAKGVAASSGGDLRAERGISGPLVLYLGARGRHKGVELLVDAARRVRELRPDVTFAFVGPGPPLASSAGIVDVGRVSEAEKARWLRAADLLCLPSAAESFGLVLLEAWSAGTPVLVSDIPTLTELVDMARGGVTAERASPAFARKILELVEDPHRLRVLGVQGREHWAAHGTPAAVASWHEQLYRRLANAGPR